MGRRKRHHTVTRALLEGFAQGGTVTQRVRRGHEFGQSINNAAVVADFYSFDSQGIPDDAMEGWLAEVIEADFTALLPDLREGKQPHNRHAARHRTLRSCRCNSHANGSLVHGTDRPALRRHGCAHDFGAEDGLAARRDEWQKSAISGLCVNRLGTLYSRLRTAMLASSGL